MKKAPRLGEFEGIARYFAPLAAGCSGALGLLDDAALLEIEPGLRLVVTADALVAGVHYPADDPPGLIARKLLRVNLSDLAAMGAVPRAYLLVLATGEDFGEDRLAAFTAGLAADQDIFGITLVGGDTVATTGPAVFSITALGTVAEGRALRRAGARPGDVVYVSGTIGDGALGLAVQTGGLADLSRAHRERLVDRYRLPCPRLTLGQRLAGLATAAIDVSDGLVADLGHICDASNVAAEIAVERVPLSAAATAALAIAPGEWDRVLGGGDDYELLFTVPPEESNSLARLGDALDLPLTAIGHIVAGEGVRVLAADGSVITPRRPGYAHF